MTDPRYAIDLLLRQSRNVGNQARAAALQIAGDTAVATSQNASVAPLAYILPPTDTYVYQNRSGSGAPAELTETTAADAINISDRALNIALSATSMATSWEYFYAFTKTWASIPNDAGYGVSIYIQPEGEDGVDYSYAFRLDAGGGEYIEATVSWDNGNSRLEISSESHNGATLVNGTTVDLDPIWLPLGIRLYAAKNSSGDWASAHVRYGSGGGDLYSIVNRTLDDTRTFTTPTTFDFRMIGTRTSATASPTLRVQAVTLNEDRWSI